MRNVFVTGTDTGVGKTVVTAAVCLLTGARPMKPVQTGATFAEDLAFVWGVTGAADDSDRACPYRLPEPLAPAVAARRAGVTIDPAVIERAYRTMAIHGPVIVEGAGGLLVEITDGVSTADLVATLGLPLVVVCRPGLGTLNHTALTLEAAAARGLDVLGLVISNYPRHPGIAERTNPAGLAALAPLVGVIPHLAGLDTESGHPGLLAEVAAQALAPELGGRFDAAAFLASVAP